MKNILIITLLLNACLRIHAQKEMPPMPIHKSEEWFLPFGIPKRCFKLDYTLPYFRDSIVGFERWLRFQLHKKADRIQEMLKKGSLQVQWSIKSDSYAPKIGIIDLEIQTNDTIIKTIIQKIFEKMPIWTTGNATWKTMQKQQANYSNVPDSTPIEGFIDSFSVDKHSLFFQYHAPPTPKFKFKLTNELNYAAIFQNPDSIWLTGNRAHEPFVETVFNILGCENFEHTMLNDCPQLPLLFKYHRLLSSDNSKKDSLFFDKLKKLINLKEMTLEWTLSTEGNKIEMSCFSKRAKAFQPIVEAFLQTFRSRHIAGCVIGGRSKTLIIGKDLEIWVLATRF